MGVHQVQSGRCQNAAWILHEAQKAVLFYAAEPMPYLPQSLYYARFSAAI